MKDIKENNNKKFKKSSNCSTAGLLDNRKKMMTQRVLSWPFISLSDGIIFIILTVNKYCTIHQLAELFIALFDFLESTT